ncbi:hypothetical protein ABBQ38_005860 [Trebouxia sp. C0009 RCD-2024]
MPLLISSQDTPETRLQILRKNDWHELRTLLGQKVLTATHHDVLGTQRAARTNFQAHLDAAFSACSQAVLEEIPDAQQACSVANALLVAVLQSLACLRAHISGTGTEESSIGQQILGAINQADLSGTGHVQV